MKASPAIPHMLATVVEDDAEVRPDEPDPPDKPDASRLNNTCDFTGGNGVVSTWRFRLQLVILLAMVWARAPSLAVALVWAQMPPANGQLILVLRKRRRRLRSADTILCR